MTSRDFCYWLMGFIEMSGDLKKVSPEQLLKIKNHLNMVFKHEIDPSFGNKGTQDTLNILHSDGLHSEVRLNC